MNLAPDVTVAAIVERQGRFLLVEEQIQNRLVINQPAGHVEADETLVAAVVREALEETAWRFMPRALLGTYLWRNPASGVPYLRFAFIGSVADHDPDRVLDHPVVTTHWLTRAELAAQGSKLRSPMVLRCIDDYLAGQQLPLDSVASLDIEAALRVRAVSL
jgi:ADP-ribose pyrophosphatase YjhB (NUDIX family)